MELVGGVVVEEKGQAWGYLPNWITVAGRQTWKFITENTNQERIWWEKVFKLELKRQINYCILCLVVIEAYLFWKIGHIAN